MNPRSLLTDAGNSCVPVWSMSAARFTVVRYWILLCGLASILVLNGEAVRAQQPQSPAIGVMSVQLEDVSPASEFVGRVEAVNAVDIRARVEGFIEERPFTEGHTVQSGKSLFILEKVAYEAAVTTARANLASAEATLKDAERRVQRSQELRRTQAVSQVSLEEAQTARDTAQANVLSAQASVRMAELNLSYTIIKAPITGRIGVAAFAVGSLVGPSSGNLARVVQVDPIRVVFSVSDRAILDMREENNNRDKQEIARKYVPMLRLSNGSSYPIKGGIDFAGNEVDQTTGTLSIRASFSNPDGLLVPGQFVTVIIRSSDPVRRPVVPVGAVQLDRAGRFVLILDENGKVAERRIKTGAQLGQNWVVNDGLAGGESLIVQGFHNARPGAAVRVVLVSPGATSSPDAGVSVR